MPTARYTADTLEQLLTRRRRDTGELLTAEEAVEQLSAETPRWYGWKNYVVPKAHLKPYLDSFERVFSDSDSDDTYGWIMRLATEASAYYRSSPEVVYRRIYDLRVEGGNSRVCTTELAEALLMAGNLSLDRDTDIPTLPGNKALALDLLYVRAEALDPKVDPRDLVKYVPTVMQLSAAIIESPELTSHLQDDAPFDCLRPWKF